MNDREADLEIVIEAISKMDDDQLLAQINVYDPYDVEFARRFRAQAKQIEAAERLAAALWNVSSSPGLAAALSAYEAAKGPKP